jgi:hypothetical protein
MANKPLLLFSVNGLVIGADGNAMKNILFESPFKKLEMCRSNTATQHRHVNTFGR